MWILVTCYKCKGSGYLDENTFLEQTLKNTYQILNQSLEIYGRFIED